MEKSRPYPHVFTPLRIGPVTVKNRIQFSPVVSAHARTLTGEVTADLIEFVGAQARSGAGMVTIGATPVDDDRARDFYGSVSVVHDYDIADLKLVADEAHRYGAKLSIELTHAGRIAYPGLLDGKPAFVPSVIPEFDKDHHVKEITPAEMREVIEHFAAAARRCRAAGFDFVTIHGAHGNLVSSFFSEVFNKRTDAYGGSLENRMRFPLEVGAAVREAVGRGMGVEYRTSGHEYLEGCPTVPEIIAFLQKLQEHVDLVNISGGLLIEPAQVINTSPSYYLPHLLNVKYAAEIKPHLAIPVAVVGGITTIDEAEELVAAGTVDIAAVAKSLIADLDLVTKAERGRADEIRPCLRCMHCMSGPLIGSALRCAVNPSAGREVKYRFLPPAMPRKKVMIVGGGPAGMAAAQVAAARGHEVTLYEQGPRLGGRLYEASAMECKDGFRRYVKWDITATERCGARIVLNQRVTPALIDQEKPDVLVLAIGAAHCRPGIAGLDLPHVITVSEADNRTSPIGERVVVCGAGLSGSECALDLAREGKRVTLVDALAREDLCLEAFELIRIQLMKMLDASDIDLHYETTVQKITAEGVEVGEGGSTKVLPADTVVTAFGLIKDATGIEALTGLVSETYLVGDCNTVGTIATANTDGFNVAVEL